MDLIIYFYVKHVGGMFLRRFMAKLLESDLTYNKYHRGRITSWKKAKITSSFDEETIGPNDKTKLIDKLYDIIIEKKEDVSLTIDMKIKDRIIHGGLNLSIIDSNHMTFTFDNIRMDSTEKESIKEFEKALLKLWKTIDPLRGEIYTDEHMITKFGTKEEFSKKMEELSNKWPEL